jgi:hypothetical protein
MRSLARSGCPDMGLLGRLSGCSRVIWIEDKDKGLSQSREPSINRRIHPSTHPPTHHADAQVLGLRLELR